MKFVTDLLDLLERVLFFARLVSIEGGIRACELACQPSKICVRDSELHYTIVGDAGKDAVQQQPNTRTASMYTQNPERYAHLVSCTNSSKEVGRYPPLSRSPGRRGVFNARERVLRPLNAFLGVLKE